MKRKFYFKKGDIQDKESVSWAQPILEKILKPGFQMAAFYTINKKRFLLTIKCFDKPVQFYEMFANSKKYIRNLNQKQKQELKQKK